MIRTYTYRLEPTMKQAVRLGEVLRILCEVYNAGLEHRINAYKRAGMSVSYYDQQREFTDTRSVRPDLAELQMAMSREPLKRLDLAFQAFFRRVKQGQTPGFPRFKSWRRFDTMTFPQDVKIRSNGKVYLPKLGEFKVRWSRQIPSEGTITTVKVSRRGRHWQIAFSVKDIEPRRLFKPTESQVGIDLGITKLVATSDGSFIENPRSYRKAEQRLAQAQRVVSVSKRGSNRRRKAVERLATQHRKVANVRKDFAHKVALRLVEENALIVHEALKIVNMSRRPKPVRAEPSSNREGVIAKPKLKVIDSTSLDAPLVERHELPSCHDTETDYLPNGASAKAGLNKSIMDAGWGMLLQFISDKAEEAGRTVIAVNPKNTSRTCWECGTVSADNRSGEKFVCVTCGHKDHADTNAAKNILRAGLAPRVSV